MSIYPVLAEYYDDLFPAKEATVEFLSCRVVSGGTLLDVGCGTGAHCCALAEKGFSVVGIDPDALMVRKAQEKVSGDNPEFHVAGFELIHPLSKSFKNKGFNSVYCIGNTLVHLPDIPTVRNSFAAVYDILVPGGSYILQIVNYDRILKDSITSLPPITAGNVTLHRHYSISDEGDRVQFEIQLSFKKDSQEKILKDQVNLLPLRNEQLMEMALSAGFSDIRLYGDFQEGKYSVDSGATILTARRE